MLFPEFEANIHPLELVRRFSEFIKKKASQEDLLQLLDLIKYPPSMPPQSSLIVGSFPLKAMWGEDRTRYFIAVPGTLLYAARSLYLLIVVNPYYGKRYFEDLIKTTISAKKILQGPHFTKKKPEPIPDANPFALCLTLALLWELSFTTKTPGIRALFYQVVEEAHEASIPKEEIDHPVPESVGHEEAIHHPVPGSVIQEKAIHHPVPGSVTETKRHQLFVHARDRGYLEAVGTTQLTSPPVDSSQIGLHVATICHSPYSFFGKTLTLIMEAMEHQGFVNLIIYIRSIQLFHAMGLFIEYREDYIIILFYDPDIGRHGRLALSRAEAKSEMSTKIQTLLDQFSNIVHHVLSSVKTEFQGLTLVCLNPNRANTEDLLFDCVPCVPNNLSTFLPDGVFEEIIHPMYDLGADASPELRLELWTEFLHGILVDTILETDDPKYIHRLMIRGLTLYDKRTDIYCARALPFAIRLHRHNSLRALLGFPDVRLNEPFAGKTFLASPITEGCEGKTPLALAITEGCFYCVEVLLSYPLIYLDLGIRNFAQEQAKQTNDFRIFHLIDAELKHRTPPQHWNDLDWRL